MKEIFKKPIIFTIILTTLFTNTNVVFCDDEHSTTIQYIVKPNVTYIDDLTGNEFVEEHEIGDKLIEPEHSDNPSYEFLGWFNEDIKWDFENDTVSDHLTLHGKYKRIYVPFDIPNTGVDGIDNFVDAVKTNNSFNGFILILISIAIFVLLFILLSTDKDDEENENKLHNNARRINLTKLIKNFFTISLCFMFVLLPFNIIAEEDEGDTIEVTEDGNYNIRLFASIEPSKYEVVIPSTVNLNEVDNFDVLAKADFFLYNDSPIENFVISCDETITLKNEDCESLEYDASVISTLKDTYTNTEINSMSSIEYTTLGNISFELPDFGPSGTYKGALTFTYSMERIEDGE